MAGPTQRGRAKRTKEKRERDKQAGRGGFGKKGGEKHQQSIQQLLNEERAINKLFDPQPAIQPALEGIASLPTSHESLISPVSDTIRSETYKGVTSEFSPHGFGDASTLLGSTSTGTIGAWGEQPVIHSAFQTPHMTQQAFLNPNTMYSFPHEVEAPGQIWNSITRTFEPWDPGLTGAADYQPAYRFPEEIEALKDEFSGLSSLYPDNDLMQLAEVTNAELNAIKLGKSVGYDETQMPASDYPSMTPDEYKGVMEGTITEPGEYKTIDGALHKKGWFGWSMV